MAVRDEHDVVIIGAGLGGLFAGNFLARRGLSVLVLEEQDQPGGYARGFWRNGFYFDAGVQSFSSNGIVRPALAELGLDREVPLERADFRWVTPWADFGVTSAEAVVAAITSAFPDARGDVESYFTAIHALTIGAKRLNDQTNPWLVSGPGRLPAMLRFVAHNLGTICAIARLSVEPGPRFARGHFRDRRLAEFFGSFGYTGAPALATAGAWGSWLYDYWYPRDGMSHLAKALARSLVECGGHLICGTPVHSVEVRSGAAQGVTCGDGVRYRAKRVIHGGDQRDLACRLISQAQAPEGWRRTAVRTPVSDTLFTAYLGVDIPAAELASVLQAHHVFVQPESVPVPEVASDDPRLHASRWVEITSPSLRDASLAPPGRSSLVLQCLSRYEWSESWHSGSGGAPNPQYRQLKWRVTGDLIRTAARVIPDLPARVVCSDAATPLTKCRMTRNSRGATAGWTWDPVLNPVRTLPCRYRTPVRGLYQVGHWTARIGGVPAAVLSAKVVADVVAGQLKH